ncbi:MAG: hypothetical protein CVU28_00125 [Betaproteobacteria bacterium HGW-Betaproteobacteria-21]|jgi:hypothetical protein|nr:MAG: hypothetical protein CVU28_00125 [Betaproteobacteria bacterium HGW-Betaproteobacteria-21]
MNWILSAAGIVLFCALLSGPQAALLLDDSTRGMTCYFYSAAAKLEWQRQGGDWSDASGAPFGLRPYATETVLRRDGSQTVSWDVTKLAQTWIQREESIGGVFLRESGGASKGVVNFSSRESANAGSHPALLIDWSDGQRTRAKPLADTYFSCPNHRAYGGEAFFKVGGRHSAVLLFPLPKRKGVEINSATLMLTSEKQYGKGASVGVFRPLLPSGDEASVEFGIAQAFSNDQGIENHPEVLHTEGVVSIPEFLPWSLGLDMGLGGHTVSSDIENNFEPLHGNALAVTIAKGNNSGLNTHFRFSEYKGGEPDEAYFRYYLRFGESWDPSVDGGKLPGFSGTYGRAGWGMRKSDGFNGWSARGAFFRQPAGDSAAVKLRGIGSYVYHAQMEGTSGETWGWSLGPSGLLQKNRWYSVEQHVRLNAPGKSDGVLRAWIDGQLVFEKRDIRFRESETLKVESVWMNVYHGGVRPADKDMTLFIDNLVIARKYIGPMHSAR